MGPVVDPQATVPHPPAEATVVLLLDMVKTMGQDMEERVAMVEVERLTLHRRLMVTGNSTSTIIVLGHMKTSERHLPRLTLVKKEGKEA